MHHCANICAKMWAFILGSCQLASTSILELHVWVDFYLVIYLIFLCWIFSFFFFFYNKTSIFKEEKIGSVSDFSKKLKSTPQEKKSYGEVLWSLSWFFVWFGKPDELKQFLYCCYSFSQMCWKPAFKTCLRPHIKCSKHHITAAYRDDCVQYNCHYCWEDNNHSSTVILLHCCANF